ncbi:stalk domain-containing protein [Cohnella cellulosilytica]|uniref:Stalk domain-containing protein n=1 Tax=Cohnella cellulosilytica TaxID=986710 RepID=A0ABW2F606_9BACL
MNSTVGKGKTKTALVLAFAATLASAPLVSSVNTASAAASGYKIIEQSIEVNGKTVALPAINTDSTTYVAIRSLNNEIGLNTRWDKASNTVTVTGRDRELVLNLGDGSATLNDQRIYGLPSILQSNTTYVPFRFLLERMGYGVSYDPATKAIGVQAIQENALKIATETIREEGTRRSISVNYPLISGMANEDVQKKINDTLKTDAELNTELARQSLEVALDDEVGTYDVSFDGTYTITYNEQDKLSLYVNYYIYTGGAHGSTARVTYTFDLKTGKQLTLADAAGGNEKYVSIINDHIQSQLKARGIGLLNPFKTIEPDRDFFLKHNGIVVFFTEYEYTPYAAGMPEFEVPFSAFE